ncbi:MAG: MOSC domain-containing protein [Dehalococcoidia bacterium]|nr:MAG: MOSC domain-containing protein [Dehalococcoidia bacterium]
MPIHVTELYRYPLKSCRGESLAEAAIDERGIAGDRQFMVVDHAGVFLTQREIPRLCQIVPEVNDGRLTLRAPSAPDVTIAIRGGSGDREVQVWDDRCLAVDQGDDVASWLTHLLGVPARLVRLADGVVRPVDPAYARQPSDQVHFGDGFPFLLVNQASLDDLNVRMGAPLPVNRFRPNIVVAGADAYAEDGWRRLKIGDLVYDVVKACSRCAITQVDQESASQGKEPLRTLAGYRMTSAKKMLFGQYLIHGGLGTIRVGDAVTLVD